MPMAEGKAVWGKMVSQVLLGRVMVLMRIRTEIDHIRASMITKYIKYWGLGFASLGVRELPGGLSSAAVSAP